VRKKFAVPQKLPKIRAATRWDAKLILLIARLKMLNPYESPVDVPVLPQPDLIVRTTRHEPVLPRYLAASLDMMLASFAFAVVGKSLPDSLPLLQLAGGIVAFFAYFILPEWLLTTTFGKLLMGLRVVQLNGTRITLRQALVRNGWRIVEVNPLLLGGMPAGAIILFSENRQRIGDMIAGTLVVTSGRARRLQASCQ
jgi:uncharacterized RDD family membrane protein YckC